jgi:hypothetical protein
MAGVFMPAGGRSVPDRQVDAARMEAGTAATRVATALTRLPGRHPEGIERAVGQIELEADRPVPETRLSVSHPGRCCRSTSWRQKSVYLLSDPVILLTLMLRESYFREKTKDRKSSMMPVSSEEIHSRVDLSSVTGKSG